VQISFSKRKPKPRPFRAEEAFYAQECQIAIQNTLTDLMVLVDLGFCTKALPEQIYKLADLLEQEAMINYAVIQTFLTQNNKSL
jgi:hypothetical protein